MAHAPSSVTAGLLLRSTCVRNSRSPLAGLRAPVQRGQTCPALRARGASKRASLRLARASRVLRGRRGAFAQQQHRCGGVAHRTLELDVQHPHGLGRGVDLGWRLLAFDRKDKTADTGERHRQFEQCPERSHGASRDDAVSLSMRRTMGARHLGALGDDGYVCQPKRFGSLLQEARLLLRGFQQGDMERRTSHGQHEPGHTAARADVDQVVRLAQERDEPQGLDYMALPRGIGIGNGREVEELIVEEQNTQIFGEPIALQRVEGRGRSILGWIGIIGSGHSPGLWHFPGGRQVLVPGSPKHGLSPCWCETSAPGTNADHLVAPLDQRYIVLYISVMPKPLNISTARKELPSLFDRVTNRRGEIVVIRRRDGDREAVLVAREYLDSLQAASRRLAPAQPFRLLGSGTALSDVETVLGAIRAEEESDAGVRIADFVTRIAKR